MSTTIKFQQIEAFKAVMQTGTTTKAALMLHTTQPSISRRIAELQSATGIRLFDLHHGRLRPTGEGKLLYRSIMQHYAGLQRIESIAAILRTAGTQTLCLGCTPTLGIGLIPPVVSAFLQAFPGTHINIQTATTAQLADYLHQGLIDLALTTGELDAQDHHPVVIEKTQAVCVLPLGHRLRDEAVVDLAMLQGERILSIGEADELTIRIKAQFLKQGLSDFFSVQTPSSVTVYALVAAGAGVGIVTPYLADTFADQLLVKPMTPAIGIAVSMAMPAHVSPALLTRRFLELLREHIEGGRKTRA